MKKRIGLSVGIAILVAVAINVHVSSSSLRGLSGISKANVVALGDDELGEGESTHCVYEEESMKDMGRFNVFKDNKLENCRKIDFTCHGEGPLCCLEFIKYDDCKPITD